MWAIEQHATIDFETYSEAGHVWDEDGQTWRAPPGAQKKGIAAVGALAYAEHPTTEVLTMSYRLPGDVAVSRWRPGLPNPQRLFDHIAAGGLLEAHNAMFERAIWFFVCRRRYGWPDLPPQQMRCSMAKARVNNLPGALENLTAVLPVQVRKNPDGKRLLNKFSIPRKPTKKDPRTRILPADDPDDAEKLYAYCDDDVRAEDEASALTMPMSVNELRFWQLDQRINWRGVGVDRRSVRNMISVLEQAVGKYGAECREITGGIKPTEVQQLRGWMCAHGLDLGSLDAEAIENALERPGLAPHVRRVLEIRQLIGSASVKKLYAFERSASNDNRVRNIITHHGARTGRPTGDLVQPLNMPKAGPDLIYCGCGKPHARRDVCPWCCVPVPPEPRFYKWPDAPKGHTENPVDAVQEIMASRSLETVEYFFGDALLSISGCMRGMIWADEGHDLIASDYSAIEAVVTAALSGCEWRMQAFRERKDIYLVSCAAMGLGLAYEDYKQYKLEHGSDHPHRQKKGKVAELALGFGGWVGAWRQFDPDGATDEEVKETILAWRKASPEIVEMWGGQERGRPWDRDYRLERYGFEGAFVNAVQYPAQSFQAHGITFFMRGDCLVVRLLSGRELCYHGPRLHPSSREYVGAGVLEITYRTWNSNPKYGPVGWVTMQTYGGRLAENIIQATAHDIQRYGIEALEAAGYPIVLHVYDENVAEVPHGFGSIEEFESIMSRMPPWAADWPVRASGGWRGRRYRKA
jgi:DNA polymerase